MNMRLQLRISYKIPYYNIEKLQKSDKFQNIDYCLLTFTKESNDFYELFKFMLIQFHSTVVYNTPDNLL